MKVMAIASAGGHWIQLLRLRPAFEGAEIEFICTQKGVEPMVAGHPFYVIPDANRWHKFRMILLFFKVKKIIKERRPQVIVTTGSAPGLMAIIAARVSGVGVKTIWIDSIANVEHLSLSGKIACRVAHVAYTQWPHLANSKILYKGNILS
jgi:UDP-N-acetylglucosamine:LPS N-acetylglucosamine transferase